MATEICDGFTQAPNHCYTYHSLTYACESLAPGVIESVSAISTLTPSESFYLQPSPSILSSERCSYGDLNAISKSPLWKP